VDPFTGCFVSRLPVTVVMLRFSTKVAELFLSGNADEGTRFLLEGFPRLETAMRFASDGLAQRYRAEREGWNLFYDALARLRADGDSGGLRERGTWAFSTPAAFGPETRVSPQAPCEDPRFAPPGFALARPR
jgi:hypothetical protein